MQHSVVIINGDKDIPPCNTKKELQKLITIMNIESDHKKEMSYEYDNGYYKHHFDNPRELLYFLGLEDL
jgi:hypothetical protein